MIAYCVDEGLGREEVVVDAVYAGSMPMLIVFIDYDAMKGLVVLNAANMNLGRIAPYQPLDNEEIDIRRVIGGNICLCIIHLSTPVWLWFHRHYIRTPIRGRIPVRRL